MIPLLVEAQLQKQAQELDELRLWREQSRQDDSLKRQQEEALAALRKEHYDTLTAHSSEVASLRMELTEAQLLREADEVLPPNHASCEALQDGLTRRLRLEEQAYKREQEQREEDAQHHREELERAVADIMSDAGSSLTQLRTSLHASEARRAEAAATSLTLQEELQAQKEAFEDLKQRQREQLTQQTLQWQKRQELAELEVQHERARVFGLERDVGRSEAECAAYRKRYEQSLSEQSEVKRQRLELREAREGLAGSEVSVSLLREQLTEALAREERSKHQERKLLVEIQALRRAHIFAEARLEMNQERTSRP
jgi:hypothetical protein